MKTSRRVLTVLALVAGSLLLLGWPQQSLAFIEAAYTLGKICNDSTYIVVIQVEKVDKEKNLIIYKKVEDLKGKHPTDVLRHNIGKAQLMNAREWSVTMQWAEPGKRAVIFHNGGQSETCIGTYWYQTHLNGDWWTQTHGEPYLLRSFCGNVDKLIPAVKEILAGREVIVPCMQGASGAVGTEQSRGRKPTAEESVKLHMGTARIQRVRASLKLLEHDEKRDFVGWGGEDFRRINGMPGFSRYSALTRVDPEAQAISVIDFDGDGKPDLCLVGGSKVTLLGNGGEAMSEVSLPLSGGARAAVWADYNASGLPSLLLATPAGPKLFTNLGKGNFRDDSHLLPAEPGYNLTAAAWIDYDGDGRPDILLANGYFGLRLYRNSGPTNAKEPLKLSKWHYIGPFDNPNMNGFNIAYPPEKEIDLSKKYRGKDNEECAWKAGEFNDGQVNNLALFKPEHNQNAVVYLHREIDCLAPMDLPVSLGSDDTITVWLNGQKLLAENVYRAAAPDQHLLRLKLNKGKNQLLMKICQGGGDWAFYFATKDDRAPLAHWSFTDVSTQVGFGPDGIGTVKGDTLTICDVNGDGRPDILYGAGTGMLLLNTGKAFVEAKDSGIRYKPGKVGPVFGDFDNSGAPALFVPQLTGGCKLFKNDGKGHFTDVTAKSGDLARFTGMACCAAWGDVDNDGHLDLVVGCLRGPNRFFRNKGDGTFVDMTENSGLHQRIFNTQGIALVDLNGDGMLDMVFNNEGQESSILLGNPQMAAGQQTPVTLRIHGTSGVVGSKVRVLTKEGKLVAAQEIEGGSSRGGQAAPIARFALKPGPYRVEVRYSSGLVRGKEITVADTHIQDVIDDQTPKLR